MTSMKYFKNISKVSIIDPKASDPRGIIIVVNDLLSYLKGSP
jgi:hypothetical protein